MVRCLDKDSEKRADGKGLLAHDFLKDAEKCREEFKQFIVLRKKKERLKYKFYACKLGKLLKPYELV